MSATPLSTPFESRSAFKWRDNENSVKRTFEAIRSPFDALEPHPRTADPIIADSVKLD